MLNRRSCFHWSYLSKRHISSIAPRSDFSKEAIQVLGLQVILCNNKRWRNCSECWPGETAFMIDNCPRDTFQVLRLYLISQKKHFKFRASKWLGAIAKTIYVVAMLARRNCFHCWYLTKRQMLLKLRPLTIKTQAPHYWNSGPSLLELRSLTIKTQAPHY